MTVASAATVVRSRPVTEIPADIESALALPDWRRRVSWPVGLAETNRIGTEQLARAFALIDSLDDPLERDAVLLALPNIAAYGRAIVSAALAASRAAARSERLVGSCPEIAFLVDGGEPPVGRAKPVLAAVPIRLGFLRRVARTYDWTGPARLLPALVAPGATAVSHNRLLRCAARGAPIAVGFRHGDALLDAARRRHADRPRPAPETAGELAAALIGDDLGDDEFARRARTLVEAIARPHLDNAARDMAALRGARLPGEIWSGSGGLYAPRAIGLEVLRRGGRVVRFDHGTPRGFVSAAEATHLLELSVSSELILATEGAAAICREERDGTGPRPRPGASLRGLDGDPTFAVAADRRTPGSTTRPRVVYAPTQLLGFRQLLPAQPPDVIYLDWQLRVAEALAALPVDLVCKPHPEGYFGGKPHPLEGVATTVRGNFAAELEKADVFVFDYPSTTALWQAACTSARIVFLDIGAGRMAPPIARLFAERATVIRVAEDDDNRPVLDHEALRAAVMAPARAIDPAPFRQLLVGG